MTDTDDHWSPHVLRHIWGRTVTDTDDLAAALEAAGLLQDEYPDDMARRSCTCSHDAVCGAHRLLARYDQLFKAFQKSNTEKREAKNMCTPASR